MRAIDLGKRVALKRYLFTHAAFAVTGVTLLILAILLIVLGLNIVFHSVKSYKASEKNSEKASV